MESNTQLQVAEEGAYDKKNPHSLYNLLPPTIQEHLLKSKNHFLNDFSPETIRKKIRYSEEYRLARKVRQSFWMEYDHAIDAGRKMQMTRIWQGICASSGEFYGLFKTDYIAVFIFTKPVAKDVTERSLLEMAYEEIEEILTAPNFRKDGALDAFAAKIKMDIWKHLDERVHGGVIKKVNVTSEQKNLNMNVTATGQEVIELQKLNRAEDLQSRLAELREQTKQLESVPAYATLIEEENDSE